MTTANGAVMTMAGGKVWSIFVEDWAYEAFGEDGPETRLSYYVTAHSEDGEVFRHNVTFDNVEEAERLADRVIVARDWVGPEVSRYWRYLRLAYGSAAYARDWRRQGALEELAEREAELGPRAAYNSLPDVMKLALS